MNNTEGNYPSPDYQDAGNRNRRVMFSDQLGVTDPRNSNSNSLSPRENAVAEVQHPEPKKEVMETTNNHHHHHHPYKKRNRYNNQNNNRNSGPQFTTNTTPGPTPIGEVTAQSPIPISSSPSALGGPEGLEKKPERVEKKPEGLEKRPEEVETKPEEVEKKPEGLEKKPERVDKKPEGVETKSEELEKRPEEVEKKPEEVETKPEEVDKKPERVEKKPEEVEKKPEEVETKPEEVDKKPVGVEKKPEGLEKRPEEVEKKPERVETKSEELEKRPEELEKKPEEVEKRPEGPDGTLEGRGGRRPRLRRPEAPHAVPPELLAIDSAEEARRALRDAAGLLESQERAGRLRVEVELQERQSRLYGEMRAAWTRQKTKVKSLQTHNPNGENNKAKNNDGDHSDVHVKFDPKVEHLQKKSENVECKLVVDDVPKATTISVPPPSETATKQEKEGQPKVPSANFIIQWTLRLLSRFPGDRIVWKVVLLLAALLCSRRLLLLLHR